MGFQLKYLDFGPGKKNANQDYLMVTNTTDLQSKYDYLIFTDSKGISIYNYNEWTSLIAKYFDEEKKTYLLITRPKEITVFFSLINFIKFNNIKFKYLITNVGFVDLTPKKEIFIDDIIEQNPFKNKILQKIRLCKYQLSSGEITDLYTLNYNGVLEDISYFLSVHFDEAYLIGTFEFSPEIKIERKRPFEFYAQLRETNKMIKKICKLSGNLIFVDVNGELPKGESILSYDAVHFTEKGHKTMFNICKNSILL